MLNLANSKPLDCILHLGAGECSELGAYLEQMPKRIILVDANQYRCSDLQKKCATNPNIEILHAVISAKSEELEFNLCNVVGLSSLRKPSGVLKLYPRFKVVQTYPVQTLAIDELIDQLAIDETGNNLLVIDTPGEEYALIMKLQESGRLNLFKYFMINSGVDELYLNARTSTEIVQLLKHNDFNLIREDISHDVDRPCLVFGVDQLKVDFIKLQLESAELNQKFFQMQEENICKQQEFEHVKFELTKALEIKQAELLQSQSANSKLTSESQAQLSKLTAELQAKEAELVTKQADFSAQQSIIAKQTEEQAIQLNQLNGQLSAKDGLLVAAQAKIDEQVKLAAQKEQQLAELNQKLAQSQTQTSVKQQEFEQTKLELAKALETKQVELLQLQAANIKITSEGQAQLSKVSTELQAKEAELVKLRQDYDVLKEKSILVLAEKLTELKAEQEKIQHLEQKVAIFVAKTNGLEQHAEQQISEINELNQKTQSQLQLNESLQSEFDLLQTNYNQQSEDLLLLRDELIGTSRRQRLLEDECTKAEAQIDLIKEFALPLALSHR